MERFLKSLDNSPEFKRLLSAWESGANLRVLRAPASASCFILARVYMLSPRPFLLVVKEDNEAERSQRELEGFLGSPPALFPSREILPEKKVNPDQVVLGERQAVLAGLATGGAVLPKLITMHPCFKDSLRSPGQYRHRILKIAVGDEIEQGSLIENKSTED